jgi:hypothetical protein
MEKIIEYIVYAIMLISSISLIFIVKYISNDKPKEK